MIVQRSAIQPAPRPTKPASELSIVTEGPVDSVRLGEAVTEKIKGRFIDELSPGQQLSFTLNNGRKILIEGQSSPIATGWFSGVKDFITAAAQEVSTAVNAGPNLALTAAGAAVKPLVLTGVPDDVVGRIDQWYSPALRGVSIAISVKKFLDRWKQNHKIMGEVGALSAMDKVGTAVDALHVLTSTAGLVGAAAGAIVPSLRGVGAAAVGVAIAGDIGSFAVNGLEYVFKRAEVQILPVPNPGPDPQPPAPQPPKA